MAYNKVIYGGKTLIDLTADTVTKDKILKGFTAHDKSGEVLTGTCDYDMNTQDMTATASEVLAGKTVGIKGATVTGTMKNNGAVNATISSKDEQYTVPLGYHDGSGKVGISAQEKAKLIPENIRQGVTVMGVEGNMSATEGANPQAKTVTPSTEAQEVLPDSDQGYNYLSQVTVEAIPYEETSNSAGGMTVTIA